MPKKQKAINRSEFIRQHINLDADSIIAAGKKKGIQITKPLISYVRHYDKTKRKVVKPPRNQRAQRRPKVVPESALRVPGDAELVGHVHQSEHFKAFQDAVGDFLLGTMQGIREIVQAEIRAHFKKLGG